MIKNEVAKMMAVLAKNYPKFDVDNGKLELWFELLGDIPYNIAQLTIKKIIMENQFPPTIAEIRKAALDITEPKQVTGAEAWGEVMFAIQRYGWCKPEEALESMSDRTRRVVKMIGWQEICGNENIDVLRGQFLKMYEQVSGRERNEALLPQSLKDQINALASKFDTKLLEGECHET